MTTNRSAILALAAAGALWGLTVPLSKLSLDWLGGEGEDGGAVRGHGTTHDRRKSPFLQSRFVVSRLQPNIISRHVHIA